MLPDEAGRKFGLPSIFVTSKSRDFQESIGPDDRLLLQCSIRRPNPSVPSIRLGVPTLGGAGLSMPRVQPSVRSLCSDDPFDHGGNDRWSPCL